MSIEAAIQENTVALNTLANLIEKLVKGEALSKTSDPKATVGNGASSTAQSPKHDAPEAAAQDKTVSGEAKTSDTAREQGKTAKQAAEALHGHANNEASVTYQQVAEAITELAKTKGKPAAVVLLQSFGVARGPELKPNQYAAVFAAANNEREEV